MSKKLLALLLIAMMLFMTACGGPQDDVEEGSTNELVIPVTYASTTMDPHYTAGATANYYWMQYVYETPTAHGGDGKAYPLICDFTESEDLTEFTLTVRDYYFHNGEKVTAEDVLACLERAASTGGSWQQNFWCHITETKIEGDTIYIKSDTPLVNFIWELGDGRGPCYITPKSICEKYADGAQIENVEDVIGTGPYMLESYNPDVAVKVVKYQDYVPTDNGDVGAYAEAKNAPIEKITWEKNDDGASRTAGLIAGDYHLGGIIDEMKEQALEAGLEPTQQYTEWTHCIFFNLDESNADSPVADVNFRKAVRAALDMEGVMMGIRSGDPDLFTMNCSPIVTSNTDYANNIIESTEWNINNKELAKEYLAKTDYAGEPIVWLTPASGAFYNAAMSAIPMLEEVGINVELKTVDSGSHGAMRNDPSTGHDIGAWETQKVINNPSNQGTLVVGNYGGWWGSEKRDELVEIMKTTPTGSEESVNAYKEFCQLVADEVPWIGFGTAIGRTWAVSNLNLGDESIYALHFNTNFDAE